MRRNQQNRVVRGVIPLLLAALAWSAAGWPAFAVTVVLQGEAEPVRGYLEREDAMEIAIRIPGVDGQRELRVIPRSEIELLIQAVSIERLEKLDPSEPRGYYEYAEELAAKRVDPEARDASLRLYLIAAFLAPHELGRGALLGMTQLARDESEQRRFQAMAFLLDPGHDRRLLEQRRLPREEGEDANRRKMALRALYLLRTGRRSEARSLARRADIAPVLDQFADVLSFAEFEALCRAVCPECGRSGKVNCGLCGGSGNRKANPSTKCPQCGGSGDIECPKCDGDFRNYGSTREALAKILRVELALRKAGAGDGVPPSDVPRSDVRKASWGQAINAGQIEPARPLQLESLTRFDPRKSLYRDGKWVESEKSSKQ